MSRKILFADSLHFHKRGFSSLLAFFQNFEIDHAFVEHEEKALLSAYGDHTLYANRLDVYKKQLLPLSKEELSQLRYKGLRVYSLAQAEILSIVLPKKTWRERELSSDEVEIFEKLYVLEKETLIGNMAVVLYWIDFWYSYLKRESLVTDVCIFSGSLIYQKTLISLCKCMAIRVFVFEHFFTGNEYYCEHKYEPIANNSDLKYPNYYHKKLPLEKLSFETRLRFLSEAKRKVVRSANKNVIQPKRSEKLFFPDQKTVLILGQVLNDFSLLESDLKNINAPSFYKELITSLITQSEARIIFKAHPWEHKKTNLKKALTAEVLRAFIKEKGYESRVVIVENFHIQSLFKQSDLVVTLCSQGALEASFEGKKVVQFGDAFYGKKGFTHDFEEISAFMQHFNALEGVLSLKEYQSFELFLLKTLKLHLASNVSDSTEILKKRFDIYKKPKEMPLENFKASFEKSKLRASMQRVKRVPLVGPSLLFVKHKVFQWK